MDTAEANRQNIEQIEKNKEGRWLQIDYTNDLSRKHLWRFIDDMREDYERDHEDKLAYREHVILNSPYTRITIMNDGYFPKEILKFHAGECLDIRLIPKGASSEYDGDLKSCPFCGSGKVEAVRYLSGFKVVCHGCGIATEPMFHDGEDIPKINPKILAIQRWNRRP